MDDHSLFCEQATRCSSNAVGLPRWLLYYVGLSICVDVLLMPKLEIANLTTRVESIFSTSHNGYVHERAFIPPAMTVSIACTKYHNTCKQEDLNLLTSIKRRQK